MKSFVTTELVSRKLWKTAKRDQKLVSPAHLRKSSHFTKLKILSQKNQRKEVSHQHLSVLGCRQHCRVNVPLGLNILHCTCNSFQRSIPVTLAQTFNYNCPVLCLGRNYVHSTMLTCRIIWASQRWHQIGTRKYFWHIPYS